MRKNLFAIASLASVFAFGATMSRAAEPEEKNEVKVEFASLPAAVKATFAKEAGGVNIASVDKETEDGKTIYEADVKIDGKNYEIKVGEDGKLVGKKLDEEEEKDEKEGKEKADPK